MTERDRPNPSPPHPDPFLEEVHRLKREAFERSGNDWDRHIERLREIERRFKDRLVQPPDESETDAA